MSGFGADELAWPAQGPDRNIFRNSETASQATSNITVCTHKCVSEKNTPINSPKLCGKPKRVEAFIAVIVVKAYSTLSIRNRLSASSYACESRRANTFGNMCISPMMNLGH